MSAAPDIEALFSAQAPTALAWRNDDASSRIARLKRLREAVLDHRAEFYQAGEADFRKPPAEVDMAELMPILHELNSAIRQLRSWMKPRRVAPTLAMLGTSASIRFEPRGRSLILAPWNYPANLALGPLVSALAAGNPAIVKPSEMTPAFAGLIERIVASALPADQAVVVQGDGQLAQALLRLPFDHIFFTGSTAIGKQVMAAAATHLSSLTLELGGKSPTIVDASADIDKAARNLCWGKFTNNGQTCIAPDHIYVHERVFDAFVDACRKALDTAYGEGATAQRQSPHLARVVNLRHARRLAGLLDDARARGARILCGGEVDVDERWIAPTLLTDLPANAQLMDEEIFGPLLPLIRYRDIEQVIADIHARPKPLALYLYSRNDALIEQVLRQTSAGGSCINTCVMQFGHGRLPFGGVNHSGLGNAHGWYGFKAFSHERAVLRERFSAGWLLYPPYGALSRRILDLLLRL